MDYNPDLLHFPYLKRCVTLAKKAHKHTKSNPMVGAVIVHNERIIGEGYHKRYGEAHAEVNAIHNVSEVDQNLLPESTIYISLEPCNTFGKTPPCTDMIIAKGIKKVIVGALDPNPDMNGKSIDILKSQGLDVKYIPHNLCIDLLDKFKANLNKECYITMKWAKTFDNYIGIERQRIKITSPATDIYTHKQRSEVDGILVGMNTVRVDNPSLTTRNYPGDNATRIVLTHQAEISPLYKIFSDDAPTVILNTERDDQIGQIKLMKYSLTEPCSIRSILYDEGIYSCIVEGGSQVLNYFIKNNLWDDAIVITNKHKLNLDKNSKGIEAPLIHGMISEKIELMDDTIIRIKPRSTTM